MESCNSLLERNVIMTGTTLDGDHIAILDLASGVKVGLTNGRMTRRGELRNFGRSSGLVFQSCFRFLR